MPLVPYAPSLPRRISRAASILAAMAWSEPLSPPCRRFSSSAARAASISFSVASGSRASCTVGAASTSRAVVSQLIDVIGFFALLIAFAIGMTAIYHDLESGAAVGIFSKPVSRLSFTAGKLAAALGGFDTPGEWGRRVAGSDDPHSVAVHERDLGDGQRLVTFVVWA